MLTRNAAGQWLKTLIKAAVITGLGTFGFATQAALVTINGANVSFTYDDTLLGLFGTPSVFGDGIFFTPTNFDAVSTNGDGQVIVNSTVNVDVTVLNPDAYVFDSFSLNEIGDYRLIGNDSSLDVGGQLRARDWTFNPFTEVNDFIVEAATPSLTRNSGNFHNWMAGAVVAIGGADWVDVTTIRVTIENVLTATSLTLGESAFIEKKFVGVSVGLIDNPIPVPATAWLFGSGLLALVGISRRKNA
jgi:hypothetical protein